MVGTPAEGSATEVRRNTSESIIAKPLAKHGSQGSPKSWDVAIPSSVGDSAPFRHWLGVQPDFLTHGEKFARSADSHRVNPVPPWRDRSLPRKRSGPRCISHLVVRNAGSKPAAGILAPRRLELGRNRPRSAHPFYPDTLRDPASTSNPFLLRHHPPYLPARLTPYLPLKYPLAK